MVKFFHRPLPPRKPRLPRVFTCALDDHPDFPVHSYFCGVPGSCRELFTHPEYILRHARDRVTHLCWEAARSSVVYWWDEHCPHSDALTGPWASCYPFPISQSAFWAAAVRGNWLSGPWDLDAISDILLRDTGEQLYAAVALSLQSDDSDEIPGPEFRFVFIGLADPLDPRSDSRRRTHHKVIAGWHPIVRDGGRIEVCPMPFRLAGSIIAEGSGAHLDDPSVLALRKSARSWWGNVAGIKRRGRPPGSGLQGQEVLNTVYDYERTHGRGPSQEVVAEILDRDVTTLQRALRRDQLRWPGR